MSFERELKRYAAYFRGWCQAFGEYEEEFAEENGITWLLGKDQVGIILPDRTRKGIYREVLGKKAKTSRISVSKTRFQLDQIGFGVSGDEVQNYMYNLLREFKHSPVLHLYLTYHLTYPSGTRFVTLSKKAPLRIIYKEIEPMTIHIE